MAHETVSEDLDVRPETTFIRSIDPNNVSCFNIQATLVSYAALFELMRVEHRAHLWHAEVCSINCDQTIISDVTFEAILPDYL